MTANRVFLFFFLIVMFLESSQQRLDAMHDEVMQIQLKYQRELERLERENKELRKQMLLRGNFKQPNRKIKVTIVSTIYIYFIYVILILYNFCFRNLL